MPKFEWVPLPGQQSNPVSRQEILRFPKFRVPKIPLPTLSRWPFARLRFENSLRSHCWTGLKSQMQNNWFSRARVSCSALFFILKPIVSELLKWANKMLWSRLCSVSVRSKPNSLGPSERFFQRGFLVIFVLVQSCVLAVYECSSEAVERWGMNICQNCCKTSEKLLLLLLFLFNLQNGKSCF